MSKFSWLYWFVAQMTTGIMFVVFYELAGPPEHPWLIALGYIGWPIAWGYIAPKIFRELEG